VASKRTPPAAARVPRVARVPRASGPSRRTPRQRRARVTVDAVLDSVARLLARGGVAAVTTNRIAEAAGVSIGSVYQYFPDKQAIFAALLARHLERVAALVEGTLARTGSASLEDRVRALVEGMIAAHAADPRLHDLLYSKLPHDDDRDSPVKVRMHAAYRRAVEESRPGARAAHGGARVRDADRAVFVLATMVESLAHAAVLRRPRGLSLADATDEAVRAVTAYLRGG
jgi:AcrR family transcriptional regulator